MYTLLKSRQILRTADRIDPSFIYMAALTNNYSFFSIFVLKLIILNA